MNLFQIIIFSVSLGVLFIGLHTRLFANTNSTEQHSHKELYYCPMHPQVTSHKAGQTCSICGMNLVKQEKNETDTSTEANQKRPQNRWSVKLSNYKQQMIGIKLAKAEKRKLFKSIYAPGRIAFDPDLYTAQNEYLEALKQGESIKNSPLSDVKKNVKEMIQSAKIRLKVLGLSESQIRSLSRAGKQTEGLLIGGSGQKNWIYADVFEMDLAYLKKGLSAEVTGSFLQGKTLAAKIISIDQVINPETRTAKVRLQLQNSKYSIRPESYVNIKIFAPLGEHLSVPKDAILDTGREQFLFLKLADGQFEPRKISISLESDHFVAIPQEFKVGEEVVVKGNFMLDSESRIKSVLVKATKNTEQTKQTEHKH